MELGTELTPHIQGYVEFGNTRHMREIKQIFKRAHFEKRFGSRSQAILYCLKDLLMDYDKDDLAKASVNPLYENTNTTDLFFNGTRIYIDGEDCNNFDNNYIKQFQLGHEQRNNKNMDARLLAIKSLIDAGKNDKELAEFDFPAWIKYCKHLVYYRSLIQPGRDCSSMPQVIVIMGPTGTGKTRWAFEQYPEAFPKQRSKWWCGYNHHKAVILDEYYAYLSFDTLLKVCDRYPLLVETKNGNVQFVADTLIFTTNKDPKLWYPNQYFPAFARRVSKWMVFNSLEDHVTLNTYDQAMQIYKDPTVSTTDTGCFLNTFNFI